MVTQTTPGVETREGKREGPRRAGGRRLPGLPFHVAVSLVEKHLPDPADLAVLRAVSKGMRDAVDATGRKVKEFGQYDARERGYLSTLKCLRRRGRLSQERLLLRCADWRSRGVEEAAAPRGEFPWDELTCSSAASGGHLETLKWARENDCPWDKQTRGCGDRRPPRGTEVGARGCPWNERTCASAASGGHLEMLKWARENDCPWNEWTCATAAKGGHLRDAQVGARERLPVERVDVRARRVPATSRC